MNPQEIQQIGNLLKQSSTPGPQGALNQPGTLTQLMQNTQQTKPGFASRVSSDINEAGNTISDQIMGKGNSQNDNPVTRGFEAAGTATNAIGKVATEALPEPARKAIGAVNNAFSGVINWLGNQLGSTKIAQDFVTQHPDAAKFLEQASKVGVGAGTVAGGILMTKGATDLANSGINKLTGKGASMDSAANANETQLHEQNAQAAQQLENSKVLDTGEKTLSQPDLNQIHTEEQAISNYSKSSPINPEAPAGKGVFQSAVDFFDKIGKVSEDSSRSTPNFDGIVRKNPVDLAAQKAVQSERFNAIVDNYNKAVKPTIIGKKTPGTMKLYNTKVVNAVQTIADNAKSLKYVTEDGNVESGRTPQTLSEMTQAVDQTKRTIYKQYNDLAKASGDKGAYVDVSKNIAPELDSVITDKALSVSHPEAVEYAKSLQDRMNKAGKLDPETAEQVIQNYNNSLKSFYRNPSYETTSRAAIDAMMVNKLRSSLDSVIENATGKQYQSLKNQYGSLKAIEGDVAKRAIVYGRQNTKGLIDFTDILSGGDVVRAIVAQDPTLFAKGAAQVGIKAFYKYLNSPDRAIKSMFTIAGSK